MSDNFLFAQLQPFTLAGAGATLGATSLVLSSFQTIDGTDLAMTDFGSIGFGTIDPGNGTREEQICFTDVTQNANGTATLTGVKSVTFVAPYTQTSGLAKSHAGGAVFVISNTSGFYDKLTAKDDDETIAGLWTFTQLPISNGGNATTGTQLITYAQALALATGTANIDRIVVAGTAGETLVAGNLVYLKVSDGRWWKCDADTAGTVDNIILGLAQGAGTAGNTVTNGVLLFGLDSNQTGLTNNTKYYASNTAGGVSSTPGTTEVTVGYSQSTTSLLFYPRYDQQITENQRDALVGTSGTPSASNKYVTDNDTSSTAAALKLVRSNASSVIAGGFLGMSVQGDMVYGDSAINPSRLALGGTGAIQVVNAAHTAPSWLSLGGTAGYVLAVNATLDQPEWTAPSALTIFPSFYELNMIGNPDNLTATVDGGGGTNTINYLTTAQTAVHDGGNHWARLASNAVADPTKDFTFSIRCSISSSTDANTYHFAGVSSDVTLVTEGGNQDRVGLEGYNGAWRFVTANGVSETVTDISGLVTETSFNSYKIVRTGSSIALYINGSSTASATHTTTLPADATSSLFFTASADGTGGNATLTFWNDFAYIQSW